MIGRPRTLPFDMTVLAKRIRELRRLLRVSQSGFAKLCGVSQPTVVRWEKGEDVPVDEHMVKIARLARMGPLKFKYGQSAAEMGNMTILIVGVIGAGEEVKKTADGADTPNERVSAPEGLEAEGLFALKVTGNAFRPIRDGWIAYYHQASDVADEVMGELCVIELASGERLLKEIRRGSEPGRYTLLSWNSLVDPLENQDVKSASVILSFKHP